MNNRMRITFGLLAVVAGLTGMAVIWVGAAPQSFALFGLGFAVAVGGAALAARAMKAGNVPAVPDGGGDSPVKLRLGTGGLVSAIIGGLLMAFTGGCTLLSIGTGSSGSDFRINAIGALVFGGFPFTIGLIMWMLAMASRKPQGGS